MDLTKIITDEVLARIGEISVNKEQVTSICNDIINKEVIPQFNQDLTKARNDFFDELTKLKDQKSSSFTIKDFNKQDVNFDGKCHKHFKSLLANLKYTDPIYIYGPTGSGKTFAITEAAKLLSLACYRKVVNRETGQHEIFGYEFNGKCYDGIAFKPFSEGGILLIDELDNGNANANTALKMLTDCNSCWFHGHGEITKHKDFRLVANANTIGKGANAQYIGRNTQDSALLNIFIYIYWPYDNEFEWSLAEAEYASYGATNIDNLKKFFCDFLAMRKATEELNINHILSPRQLLQATRRLATWENSKKSLKDILYSCIFRGIPKEQKDKIVNYAQQHKRQFGFSSIDDDEETLEIVKY